MPSLEQARILLVDDDESMRFVLSNALRNLGARVTVLEDGAEVPEAVASRHYDLVVMDLYMGGMNGFEVLRRLRKPEEGRLGGGPTSCDVPVVVVSGETDAASVANARARGANEYLFKPVDLGQLETTVRDLLRAGS